MDTITQTAWDWITHLGGSDLLWVAGAATIPLVVLAVVARQLRKYKLAQVATLLVTLIVLGTTVEGAIKFATYIGGKGPEIVFPAVVFEAIGIAIYGKAREYAQLYQDGPGRWGKRLYLIGFMAGFIVATAATNFGMILFRFGMPLAAAWLVNMELEPNTRDKPKEELKLRWSRRRVLAAIGFGEDPDRMVRKIAKLRHRLAFAEPTSRRASRYRLRLSRLVLVSDQAIVDRVRARVTLSLKAEGITGPSVTGDLTDSPATSPTGESGRPGDPSPVSPTGDQLASPVSSTSELAGEHSPVNPTSDLTGDSPVTSDHSPAGPTGDPTSDPRNPPVTPPTGDHPPAATRGGEPSPVTHLLSLPGRKPKASTTRDAEVIASLRKLPRNPDGTVPVDRARKSLGIGTDRARRLLGEAGLLTGNQ